MQYVSAAFLALQLLGPVLAPTEEIAGAESATEAEPPEEKTPESSPNLQPDLTREELEQLVFLGYVDGTPVDDADAAGVTIRRPGAREGLNLLGGGTAATLIDMDGTELHRWSRPSLNHGLPRKTEKGWSDCHLYANGDILALSHLYGIVKLDRDSELLWKYEDLAHHTFSVDTNGDIYFLALRETVKPQLHPSVVSVVDVVVALDANGKLKWTMDLVDVFLASRHSSLLPSAASMEDRYDTGAKAKTGRRGVDVLHVNRVEVLDGSLEHLGELYARGNLLLSSRRLDAVFVVDPTSRRILWLWGPGELYRQHSPTSLSNGHFLIFDNGRESSRVVEVDPASSEIAWMFGPTAGFFSKNRGAAQRLDNGNTLITESTSGRAFEVTREGETVWEYLNTVNPKGVRKALWEVKRIDPACLSFIDAAR